MFRVPISMADGGYRGWPPFRRQPERLGGASFLDGGFWLVILILILIFKIFLGGLGLRLGLGVAT